MKKIIVILAALLAVRLLPKALRREAQALELIMLLFQQVAGISTANLAVAASANATQIANTAAALKAVKSQAGTTGGTLSTVSASHDNAPSGGSGGGADNPGGGTSNTSGQIGGASAHIHSMQHGHYYGDIADDLNNIINKVNTIQGALQAAGIL